MKIETSLLHVNRHHGVWLLITILLLSLFNNLKAAVYLVANIKDFGVGSLRQAILNANANVLISNDINLNIPGAVPHAITTLSAFSELTSPVHICAHLSQPTPSNIFDSFTDANTAALSFGVVSDTADWQLDDAAVYPLNINNYGNEIPNHLDLDSDNHFDGIESMSTNILSSNLENSAMNYGLTRTYKQPAVQNLGNYDGPNTIGLFYTTDASVITIPRDRLNFSPDTLSAVRYHREVRSSTTGYASLSNKVINRLGPDSDGDGIQDDVDLDDDNDGILDTNEGFCQSQTVYTTNLGATFVGATFGADGGAFNLVYSLTSGPAVAGLGALFNVPFSYSDFINTATSVNHSWEGFNITGSFFGIRPVTSQLYSGLPVNNSTSETRVMGQTSDWNFRNWLSTGALDKLGTFTTAIGNIPTPSNQLSSYSSNTPLRLVSNFNVVFAAVSTGGYYAKLQAQTIIFTGTGAATLDYNASYGQSYVWDYTAFNDNPASNDPNNGGDRGLITISQNTITFCNHRDTDGDGIPDYLDLDSDNDGCSDAIEGASTTITNANLVNSAMPGGNSGATTGSYNQPVIKNLGNVVNTTSGSASYGVPTIAGSGQGIGYATNTLVNVCCVNFPNTATATEFTKTGISNLAGFVGGTTGWPGNIPNGFIAIESKRNGFVITRVKNVTDIPNAYLIEGMMVYDVAAACTKIYNGTIWKCLGKDCN